MSVRQPDVRVTMIENDGVFADAVMRYFARLDPPIIVEHRSDARGIREHSERARPDVVILDPEQLTDAARTVTTVRAVTTTTRIIALTLSSESTLAAELARAGMIGWVGKNEPLSELVDAITAVTCGSARFPARHIDAVMQMLGHCSRSTAPDCRVGNRGALSKREQQVLAHILAGASARQIADELHLSTNTIRSHRRRIGAKLGVGS